MKLTSICLFIGCLQVSATAYPQEKSITLSLRDVSLDYAFNAIKDQSGYFFMYNEEETSGRRDKVTVEVKDASIEKAMEACLKDTRLTYHIVDKTIVITPKPSREKTSPQKTDPLSIIRGKVLDQNSPPSPLTGVTVQIKGTSRGVVTDSTGFFEIEATPGDVLMFSYVGFEPSEYTIKAKENDITVSLKTNAKGLDQVVVTGYSEQKVRNLASSISVLPPSNIQSKPITQLSQALQGGVTGLTVTQGSGLPGGDAATIKMRGINTLGYTDPLVLVDGVPFDLNNVDPTTVESITVLKDAAAASIYGARAANGVILVTTKRGVPGKVQVTYDAYAGVQKATYVPKFVDAPTYMQMVNEADENVGRDKTYSDDAINITRNGTDPLHYPNTDWSKLILKSSPFIMNHTLGITGGNSLARFAVTASYLDQEGVIMNTDYNRFMLRANTSLTLRKNLSMYLDLNVVRGDQSQSYGDDRGNSTWIFYVLYGVPPNIVAKYPVRDDGLVSYGNFGEMRNPLANLEVGGTQKVRTDNVTVNFRPSWEIVPGLNLKLQYDFQITAITNTVHRDPYNFIDYFTNNLIYTFDAATGSTFDRSTYNYLSGTLDYTKNIGKHHVFLLGGVSQEYNSPNAININTLRSVFGKMYYSYDERFLVEAALRGDGSSRFGSGHKWGAFPSAALGWNIGNEKFMKSVKPVSDWKLRASYGLMGNNQNVGNYAYQSTISSWDGVENSFGNPNITWEKTKMLDLGTNIGFFHGSLNLVVDWFDKITDDILLAPPVSLASGLGSTSINAGKVRNRGWEFSLNFNKNVTQKLNLNGRLGLSSYKNTILSLPGGPYVGNTIQQQGQPIGMYYGYKTDGLLQEDDMAHNVPVFAGEQAGDIKYVDVTGDGELTDADRVVIGNPTPRVNYFLDLGAAFHSFDFEVLINGYGKNTIVYSGRAAAPLDVADPGAKPMTWQMDYWTPENTNARYPRLVPNGLSSSNVKRFSDFWFEDAAYARVKFVQLGYSFSQSLLQRYKIGTLRIYVNAQNPLTITKLPFLDPESKGEVTTYPLMRMYTAGVTVKF
jgi:TonB-linked SusC/RagA family outer membrane protein